MTFAILKCFGQTNEQAALYLTNYTFSQKQNNIGFVKIKASKEIPVKSISISGNHASLFQISKDHQLSIRQEKLKPGVNWLDVVLTVKTLEGTWQDTFRLVKDEFTRNKVIAHRGAWKNTGAPENSIAALNQAIAMGCEGSEFDVHLSSDSVAFINHDPHIQGISIAKTTSDQLSKIKLPNGESLPTLRDYLLAGTQQNKTKLILEIKASESGKASSLVLTHQVVKLVEKLQAQAWVDYISFDYEVCKELMKMAPYAKVAYLNGDKTPDELAQQNFFGLDYHYSVLQKNPDWIKEAKQKKLTVNAWTVNSAELMDWLLQEKVDFITTNEPELLLQKVNKPVSR